MPAPLLPDEAIPVLAEQLDLPMISALRRASLSDFIMNDSSINAETTDAFKRLADRQLVDAAQSGQGILHWTITHNGKRVQRYFDAQTGAKEDEDAPPDTSGKWLPSSCIEKQKGHSS